MTISGDAERLAHGAYRGALPLMVWLDPTIGNLTGHLPLPSRLFQVHAQFAMDAILLPGKPVETGLPNDGAA